ncbi:MAG: aldo/keto reductase [Lachnospiraceae bacterium]|nr:aldo/keto reductase [Lachnospiraceae bacterium]
MEMFTLRDGNQIPCMGFGCYNAFGEEIRQAVMAAVEAGYRYIDSAEKYGNEEDVGKAIAHCSAPREELRVLSKVWPTSYDDPEGALTRSMKALQVEYLDYYLIHWPGTDEARRLKAYEKLLSLRERGLIRTVGVSNFQIDQLEKVKEEFGDYPAINEIERHPSYQQRELGEWCREKGIRTISYSPINRSADLTNDTVQGLAEKYGKTPAQVVLRWHVEKQQLPIPKSGNLQRIRENVDVFEFSLQPEEVSAIDALERGARSGLDPRTFNG